MGDTLSDSGQINNQQITVPECRLHEDIGSLLLKQTLTDVTLVVMASPTSPAQQIHDNSSPLQVEGLDSDSPALPVASTDAEETGCRDTEANEDEDEGSKTPSRDDTEEQTADGEGEGDVSSALPLRGILRVPSTQPPPAQQQLDSNEAVRKPVPPLVSCSACSSCCPQQQQHQTGGNGDNGERQKHRHPISTYSASSSSSSITDPLSMDGGYAYSDGESITLCETIVQITTL